MPSFLRHATIYVLERDFGEGVYVFMAWVEHIDGYIEVVSDDLSLVR